MKRSMGMGLLATASLALFGSACAQNGFAPIAVTQSASTVASCQSMGEVKASRLTPDYDVNRDLTEAARNKGANTILVSSEDARKGTAYQCAMPSSAASPSGSGPGR